MTDEDVQRLRDYFAADDTDEDHPEVRRMMVAAANEIDRLRAEIRRMTGCPTAAELDAERERVATLDRLQSERDHAIAEQGRLEDEGDQLLAEIERLRAALNTPVTEDFSRGVEAEAAHQRERWGSEHDAGKRPEDWIALCVYLLGKATKAHYENDRDKYLHHLISTAAVLANAHLNATGADTRMRPGIDEGNVCRHYDELQAVKAELTSLKERAAALTRSHGGSA